MPADTLQNMALRQLGHRGRDIHDFGVVPVHLIKTIIPKIANPDQLRLLEQRSPQIIGHTREVWLSMLKRDIPHWKERLPDGWEYTIFSDQNAARWHKVYFKLKQDVEREKEKSRAVLIKGLKESAAVRGPETAVRAREPLYLGDKKRVRKTYSDAKFAMNNGMYTKTKGEGFFDKVKRNAATKASSKRVAPTRTIKPALQRVIKRAPLGMVEDIKESREAVIKNVGLPPNDRKPGPAQPGSQRAPAQNMTSAAVAKLTADFLEDYDDDMDASDHDTDDELFGISRPAKRKATSPPNPPPSKKRSPPHRTASPLPPTKAFPPTRTAVPPATQSAPRRPVSAPRPTVVKRTKPARSIFARK